MKLSKRLCRGFQGDQHVARRRRLDGGLVGDVVDALDTLRAVHARHGAAQVVPDAREVRNAVGRRRVL